MTIYAVFINWKKGVEETLNEYYESIMLGTVVAKMPPMPSIVGPKPFSAKQSRLMWLP
ncbi:hypothetical protein KDA_76270 [Dictyobacter alpinus]|uniref:Uncharacterized protein n=1 Tax=Dictyobacter alpinus TaxID=2014873 RepID=A0A402BLA4_9CHLR|nr:hypothetical protein KDA_76270 [Dictyobacter alpinus]